MINPPPASAHVFLVVEENHSYSQVIGNPAMPYLNSLASRYGLATQYYANVHASIGNYFMLTDGQIETVSDAFSGTVSHDNLVRELAKANKSWRSYAESLPGIGYLGGDVFPYFKHHNPFAYFSDVVGTGQANNIVPFSQFAADLGSGGLPDFSFIVPNALNDAHDGSLASADQWLNTNIDPLIKSSGFHNNGLLVIVFDESVLSDLSHGGGHVMTVVVGPQVKNGFQSATFFQHQSTLRLLLSTLGVNSFPGRAASAPDMGEFFKKNFLLDHRNQPASKASLTTDRFESLQPSEIQSVGAVASSFQCAVTVTAHTPASETFQELESGGGVDAP